MSPESHLRQRVVAGAGFEAGACFLGAVGRGVGGERRHRTRRLRQSGKPHPLQYLLSDTLTAVLPVPVTSQTKLLFGVMSCHDRLSRSGKLRLRVGSSVAGPRRNSGNWTRCASRQWIERASSGQTTHTHVSAARAPLPTRRALPKAPVIGPQGELRSPICGMARINRATRAGSSI